MTNRDELAYEIRGLLHAEGAYCGSCDYESASCYECDNVLHRYADAILDSGYRKPRTITTVEELDELPNDTALRDAYGQVAVIYKGKLGDRPYLEVQYAGTEEMDSHYGCIALPATVLYVPEEAS